MILLCTERVYFQDIQDEINRVRYYKHSAEELIDIVFDKSIVSKDELNKLYQNNLLRVAKRVIVEFLDDSGYVLGDVESHHWDLEHGYLYIKIYDGLNPYDSSSLPYLGVS